MCSCAEFILYVVNMTFLLAGLAITGLASYLLVLHGTAPSSADIAQELAADIPAQLVYPILGVGLVCALIAVLGICGVCMKKAVLGRCLLFLYGSIVLVVIVAEVSLGAALLAWQGGAEIADLQNQEASFVARLANETYPECCNATTHTIIPQPPPAGQVSCPLPNEKAYILPGDCQSALTLQGALNRILSDIVTPVAGGTLGFAGLQLLSLILICWVASEGRRQAAEAEDKARTGAVSDSGTLWLLDASVYGDSAAGDGRDPGAFSNAATTPQYVRF